MDFNRNEQRRFFENLGLKLLKNLIFLIFNIETFMCSILATSISSQLLPFSYRYLKVFPSSKNFLFIFKSS